MSVTPDMLAVALGVAAPTDDTTFAQWQMWIDDAYMLIDARQSDLGVTLEPAEAKVDYVVREAVVAHIRKPDDATQVTISVDDGSSSRTYQSSKGRVTIVDEWWKFLGLVPQGGGAFAVDMIGFSSQHLPWCASSLGALYCSCGVDIAGRPIFEGAEE